MSTYDTNLAAEFHVLSMLHRLGAEASLTLGNKKAVDIVVACDSGRIITIDVKGVAGRHDWPCDNLTFPSKKNHFIVLVSFEGKIADPQQIPSAWVVPADELQPFVRSYRVRQVVVRSQMRSKGTNYFQAWGRILDRPGT